MINKLVSSPLLMLELTSRWKKAVVSSRFETFSNSRSLLNRKFAEDPWLFLFIDLPNRNISSLAW